MAAEQLDNMIREKVRKFSSSVLEQDIVPFSLLTKATTAKGRQVIH